MVKLTEAVTFLTCMRTSSGTLFRELSCFIADTPSYTVSCQELNKIAVFDGRN
jgi:hypothetical protein